MSNPLQSVATVLGRLMLVTIFLASAVGNKIPNFGDVAQAMASVGIPFPQVMLVGAIAFMLLGGVAVVVGFKARFGAALLLVFLALATFYFHGFWNFEGAEQQAQIIQFMKNLSIAGAMLLIMANGPGPLTVDRRSAEPAVAG